LQDYCGSAFGFSPPQRNLPQVLPEADLDSEAQKTYSSPEHRHITAKRAPGVAMVEQMNASGQDSVPREKRWIDNMSAIASALIAIGTLLNWFFGRQNASFPHWFFYILTALILVMLYKYFEEGIRRAIQTLAVKNFLRQAHFQLLDSLQRYSDLVTQKSDDSIVRIMETIGERTGSVIVDPDVIPYIDQLISNILLKLSDSGKNASIGEFKGMVNDLNTLIRFTTHFYFKRPLNGKDASEYTPEELKSLELARENYADFLRRYQVFFDEVQTKLGSSVRAHFEIPKPISYISVARKS
jgi:hypothetical protein